MANFVATGAFYPMIVLCGLLWPLEGMPQLLKHFSLFLPFTIPAISVIDIQHTPPTTLNSNFCIYRSLQVRNILVKGLSVTNPEVYNGFIVVLLWIAAFFFLCMAGLRRIK